MELKNLINAGDGVSDPFDSAAEFLKARETILKPSTELQKALELINSNSAAFEIGKALKRIDIPSTELYKSLELLNSAAIELRKAASIFINPIVEIGKALAVINWPSAEIKKALERVNTPSIDFVKAREQFINPTFELLKQIEAHRLSMLENTFSLAESAMPIIARHYQEALSRPETLASLERSNIDCGAVAEGFSRLAEGEESSTFLDWLVNQSKSVIVFFYQWFIYIWISLSPSFYPPVLPPSITAVGIATSGVIGLIGSTKMGRDIVIGLGTNFTYDQLKSRYFSEQGEPITDKRSLKKLCSIPITNLEGVDCDYRVVDVVDGFLHVREYSKQSSKSQDRLEPGQVVQVITLSEDRRWAFVGYSKENGIESYGWVFTRYLLKVRGY